MSKNRVVIDLRYRAGAEIMRDTLGDLACRILPHATVKAFNPKEEHWLFPTDVTVLIAPFSTESYTPGQNNVIFTVTTSWEVEGSWRSHAVECIGRAIHEHYGAELGEPLVVLT